MAKYVGTIGLNTPIAPKDDADTNPTHYAKFGKGGFMCVASEAERLAIPADRREEGMEVKQISDGKKYELIGGIANANWSEVVVSGGGASEAEVTALQETVASHTSTLAEHTNTIALKADKTELTAKADKTAVDNLQSQVTNIVTASANYYSKCLQTDTGALLVVDSGATTGQINLADVTPKVGTIVANDYVKLNVSTPAEVSQSRDVFDTLGARLDNIKSISGLSVTSNLLNASKMISGIAIKNTGAGTTTMSDTETNASYYTYPVCVVEAGKNYRAYDQYGNTIDNGVIGWYNSSGVSISFGTVGQTNTAPTGATYCRFSSLVNTISQFKLTSELAWYVPYGYKYNQPDVPLNKLKNIKSSLVSVGRMQLWATGTQTFDGTTRTVTLATANDGVQTNAFASSSNSVRIRVKGSKTCTSVDIVLVSLNSSWAMTGADVLTTITDNTFDVTLTYDAAYYAVYRSAYRFEILIRSTQNTGTISLTTVSATEDDVEGLSIYSEDLPGTLKKIDSKIVELTNKTSAGTSSDVFVNGMGGAKYKIQINPSGTSINIPVVPSKMLFCGNSITLGMDTNGAKGGAFGMAATTPYKDYAYLVKQAILAKNASCTVNKLHVAAFEQCETVDDANAWWTSNSSNFTSDLNLIILQLGDNVNTDARKATYATTFPALLQKIYTACPNVRIIVVSGWFNIPTVEQTQSTKYGAEFVNISSLNTTANQGYVGQVTTYYDNTTETINPAFVTHPGDTGMAAIAAKLITQLNM